MSQAFMYTNNLNKEVQQLENLFNYLLKRPLL